MRLIVVLVVGLGACGTSDSTPTPFDQVACDTSWHTSPEQPVPASCDRECVTKPANYDGSGADSTFCYASRPDSSEMTSCERSFVDGNGIRGCCRSYVIDPTTSTSMLKLGMHFYECE